MIKKKLSDVAEKSSLGRKTKQAYKKTRENYYKKLPIQSKQILFESYRSSKYACSPKALYEYLLNNPAYKDYTFIWSFQNPEKYSYLRNSRTALVKYRSKDYFKAAASSKYWFFNGWAPLQLVKKPGQVMLQCWHGTPLKRLRNDIIDTANTEHGKHARLENDADVSRYDYFISPSKFATEAFTTAFDLIKLGKENIIIETGYPRNDFLHTYSAEDVQLTKQKYFIPKDKKVLLYAPTWRDRIAEADRKKGIDLAYLKEQLGDDYVLLYRAHYLEAEQVDFDRYIDFAFNVSEADDINELYIIADVLVTDYSSVFFDYANLNRPMIFFMYDKEQYEKELRGFYMDLRELPGKIVTTNEELTSELNDLNHYAEKYVAKVKKFNNKFTYLDDGMATARVISKVLDS